MTINPNETENPEPLVSIGVPVRNGGDTLKTVLEGISNQTYQNIEIIISDNQSTDQTEKICAEYLKNDKRIRYVRHDVFLSALDNFKFVASIASSEYFMWAAHDDLRAENYVEVLVKGLEENPKSSLVFSDLIIFSDYKTAMPARPLNYPFDSSSLSLPSKIKKYSAFGCYHIYGLIRRKYLLNYPWLNIDYGPDTPLLLYLVTCGDFTYIPGTSFYYYVPPTEADKTPKLRAIAISGKKLRAFPELRLYWVSAKTVKMAMSDNGNHQNHYFILYWIITGRLHMSIKAWLYFHSPYQLRDLWRHLKHRFFIKE